MAKNKEFNAEVEIWRRNISNDIIMKAPKKVSGSMSVMHASPWRPNIPREAIKQNSKITWLSYLQHIWQTFCNIYLMVKLCIANFHFLNLNIHARSHAGSRHHGVAGPVSQVARVRWVFERITLQGFEKITLQGGNEPWTSSWGFWISVPRKKALNILNLTLP